MPAEFVALARACLQPDPRRRATPGGLAARLRQPAEPPRQPSAPAPPKSLLRRRGPVLVAGVGCALAALLAGPRLLHRPASPDTVAAQPAPAPPQPEHPVPKAETPPITQETGGKEANAVETAPPAPPVTPPGGRADKERKSSPERPGLASAAEQTASPTVDHAGAVVRQILPGVPERARSTIHGKVRVHVRASVDSSGHVTSARLESRGSRYLSNLTLEAARQWVFEPAAGEWLLRFEITSKGTVVQTSRVSP
jgi:TonB family protein